MSNGSGTSTDVMEISLILGTPWVTFGPSVITYPLGFATACPSLYYPGLESRLCYQFSNMPPILLFGG